MPILRDAVRGLRRGGCGDAAVAASASCGDRCLARQSGDRLWFPSLSHRHKYDCLGLCDRSGRPRCNHGFNVGAALVAANRQSRRYGLRLHRRLYRLRARPFRGHTALGGRGRLHVGNRRTPRRSEPPMADRVGRGLRSVPNPQPCPPASNGVVISGIALTRVFRPAGCPNNEQLPGDRKYDWAYKKTNNAMRESAADHAD
jgi:hypothetical protein